MIYSIFKYFIVVIIIFSFFNLFNKPLLSANLQDAFTGNPNMSDTPLEKIAGIAKYDTSKADIDPIIGTIIQATLSLLGVIFIILIIYGGGLWMTAKGNEQQVDKARNLITAAIIGLVIVVAAYAISYFVIKTIGGAGFKKLE